MSSGCPGGRTAHDTDLHRTREARDTRGPGDQKRTATGTQAKPPPQCPRSIGTQRLPHGTHEQPNLNRASPCQTRESLCSRAQSREAHVGRFNLGESPTQQVNPAPVLQQGQAPSKRYNAHPLRGSQVPIWAGLKFRWQFRWQFWWRTYARTRATI
jgi:hypothetical protein